MSDLELPRIPAEAIEDVARRLTITDFVTGRRTRWIPSKGQRAAWELSEANQRSFIGKPRRAYISTAFDLEDVLHIMTWDAHGHRTRGGVMLDVEDKVTERMWQMSDFLTQLGVQHHATDYYIEFPRKSEMVGLTAGGKRAAASTGFQRMRYSEFAYYSDPGAMASTSSSVGKMGHEVIETTIDVSAANGKQARQYWRDPANGFTKLFIPFEWHLEYRCDASRITEEQWTFAQTEGFTIREAAAYWLAELLPNKCGGDLVQLMHEFPQLERHMFQVDTGRWVRTTPRVLEPVDVWRVMGPVSKEMWPILVYKHPRDVVGHPITITADAAKGTGTSRATVLAIDDVDGRVVACFADANIEGDDHARVAWEMWQRYASEVEDLRSPTLKATVRPRVYAEDNTTGRIFIQPAGRLGLPVHVFDTNEVTQVLGMQKARQAVHEGRFECSKELAEECDECTRDPLTGKFKGHKDLLMSYGFWAVHAVPVAQTVKESKNPERRVDGRAMVLAAMRQQQLRRW